MQVGCGEEPLVGVNVPYSPEFELKGLTDSCNVNCTCTEEYYNPICYNPVEGTPMTYFTPCHAGCSKNIIDENGVVRNDIT